MNATRTTTTTSKKPKAPSVSASLSAWRDRMGYSIRDAVKALGCSKQAWQNWESGKQAVPRYIGLAMAALALGMEPYGELQKNLNGDC